MDEAGAAAFDEGGYRRALGAFPTGVAIATAACAREGRVGLTMNSFSSVSLRPPIVCWNLNSRSPSRGAFDAAAAFALHVLSADQSDLARRFARAERNRFAGLSTTDGLDGAPLLAGCAAVLECRPLRKLEVGDHVIYFGEVARFTAADDREALAYYRGGYARTAPLA